MKNEVIYFFDKFVQDFKTFDGILIANRYLAPYTAIRTDKSVSLYNTQKDIELYFSSILADYKKQEVEYCTYTNFEYTALGNGAALATMNWKMMKADGMLVSQWRESYILILSNTVLKIVTSIDH